MCSIRSGNDTISTHAICISECPTLKPDQRMLKKWINYMQMIVWISRGSLRHISYAETFGWESFKKQLNLRFLCGRPYYWYYVDIWLPIFNSEDEQTGMKACDELGIVLLLFNCNILAIMWNRLLHLFWWWATYIHIYGDIRHTNTFTAMLVDKLLFTMLPILLHPLPPLTYHYCMIRRILSFILIYIIYMIFSHGEVPINVYIHRFHP